MILRIVGLVSCKLLWTESALGLRAECAVYLHSMVLAVSNAFNEGSPFMWLEPDDPQQCLTSVFLFSSHLLAATSVMPSIAPAPTTTNPTLCSKALS